MSYTGNTPETQSFVAATDYFSGNGVQTSFTLSRSVNSVNDILIIVGGQEISPLTYSVTANTVTFNTAPAVGSLNVVVRYLTTTLFQNINVTNQGIGYLNKLIDASVTYSSATSTVTVTNIISSTQMRVSGTGLSAGTLISSSQANFSGTPINFVDNSVYSGTAFTVANAVTAPSNSFQVIGTTGININVGDNVSFSSGGRVYTVLTKTTSGGNTVFTVDPFINANVSASAVIYTVLYNSTTPLLTVGSTAQWGNVGNITTSTIYTWTAPNNGSLLSYASTSQKWTPNSIVGIYQNNGISLGFNNLNTYYSGANNLTFGKNNLTSVTTGANNMAIGSGAGSAIQTANNHFILGNYSGYTAGTLDMRFDGSTTSGSVQNGYIVVADTLGNIRALCNNLGNWGFGTVSPRALVDINGLLNMRNSSEVVNISTDILTGTYAYSISNANVLYFTNACTGNFTFNFTWSSTPAVTLNNTIGVGQSTTVAVITTQGSTAFFHSGAIQIDGTSTGVTTRWQGPAAPSFGNASGFDLYMYNIVKTASTPTYTIFASRTQFGG
jgi:hypothetical protein